MLLNHLFTVGVIAMGILASQTSNGQESHQQLAIIDIEKVMKAESESNKELAGIRKKTKALKSKLGEDSPVTGELKKLDRREAEILLVQFTKISACVATIAKENEISLVLTFDSKPIKKDETFTTAMISEKIRNNPVFHRQLDLTRMVMNKMAASRGQSPIKDTEKIESTISITLPVSLFVKDGSGLPTNELIPIRGTLHGQLEIERTCGR